jgi:peptide/nickel transport system substrate-binding protein
MLFKKLAAVVFFAFFIFISCSDKGSGETNRVIIGVPSDVETINPLYAFSINEGNITELLFLSLIKYEWDELSNNLKPSPMLAKKWEWNSDSTQITFHLREDVYWSDGKKFTADDVVFSFDVYSDPLVQSKLYGTFSEFYTDEENHIDIEKTFDVANAYLFTINFPAESSPTLFDVEFPIIAKHTYMGTERENFQTSNLNFEPISNGPFKLLKWNRNQAVILGANTQSYLYSFEAVNEIIFKVVPDYSARLTQLSKGEIDLMEDLKPEDAKLIEEDPNLKIETVEGREYDYIGWNNIDPQRYKENSESSHHPLFGSSNVRIALSMALNREEVLETYLNRYGSLATGPVAPIFKDALNPDLEPYPFNPDSAKQLLREEGWIDRNNNGILDKNGIEFEFKLNIASGNPRREYAATIYQNNLKSIGIDVSVETIELGTFIDNLYARSFDAWMIGWFVPIPLELKPYWYSDTELAPLNFVGYNSRKADELMDKLELIKNESERNKIFSNLEKIIHEDEPVTFLYWIDNIVGYNKKINKIKINPLGVIHHCWEWEIEK